MSAPFAGTWRNPHGSELTLVQDGDAIRGAYRSAIGDERVRGRALPLVGRATGGLVGFVVAFPEAGSLTSWSGRLVREGASETLVAAWHRVRETDGADPPRALAPWESVTSFTSVFERVEGPREGG